MNATISIGITEATGKTDVLVIRNDRQEYLPITKTSMTRTRAHNNITDASFSRLARFIARRATLSHETGTLMHYKAK
jgi:hypothetical protein